MAARRKRVDYPGAWHHVMNRGARRAPIFAEESDCGELLRAVGETVSRFGVEVHAYALMPNHYHLLVRSLVGDLSRAMRHLNGVYTQRVNLTHAWDGPVFRGRFHSKVVEDESYLGYLVAYIHLNPVRAGLVRRWDEPCWTSHRAHVGLDPVPPWLSTGEVARLFDGPEGLERFVRQMRQGSRPPPDGFESIVELFRVGRPPRTATAPEPPARATAPRPLESESVLAELAAVTGVDVTELLRPVRGRGANPPRRFAALALIADGRLTAAQIAQLLIMPVRQVHHLASRADLERLGPPFDFWLDAWSTREMGNGYT